MYALKITQKLLYHLSIQKKKLFKFIAALNTELPKLWQCSQKTHCPKHGLRAGRGKKKISLKLFRKESGSVLSLRENTIYHVLHLFSGHCTYGSVCSN